MTSFIIASKSSPIASNTSCRFSTDPSLMSTGAHCVMLVISAKMKKDPKENICRISLATPLYLNRSTSVFYIPIWDRGNQSLASSARTFFIFGTYLMCCTHISLLHRAAKIMSLRIGTDSIHPCMPIFFTVRTSIRQIFLITRKLTANALISHRSVNAIHVAPN